jgi:hypothetical protein
MRWPVFLMSGNVHGSVLEPIETAAVGRGHDDLILEVCKIQHRGRGQVDPARRGLSRILLPREIQRGNGPGKEGLPPKKNARKNRRIFGDRTHTPPLGIVGSRLALEDQ